MSGQPLSSATLERPRDMRAFRDLHAGATMLVAGCGPSLDTVAPGTRCLTIGVNDVGRVLQPDYLVVVNPRTQFSRERLELIENTRATAVFSQLADLQLRQAPLVRFRLGDYNGVARPPAADALHYTQNSPYVAVCLALHLGARRIGLIGVDFTAEHSLGKLVERIDAEYGKLVKGLQAQGIEIFNLSAGSRLRSLPRQSLDEFVAGASQPRERSLNIVSYATTPVAGVPAVLAKCIAARTAHRAQCVWATDDYGNGVRFEGGRAWHSDPGAVIPALKDADLVILHNGKTHESHRKALADKPIITMAHNYAWNVDLSWVERGHPGVVVGQYQATLPEFRGWTAVPNPIPWWEPCFSPGDKGEHIRICFTPSGQHERYPSGHRLFWHAKGYETTLRVLNSLARRYPIIVETTSAGQVSHAESLAMKQRAHIVIDECVTGSYHRNSLEGLAAGCVVVNGVGLLPSVREVLLNCVAPSGGSSPFVFARLEGLEAALIELIELGAAELLRRGAQGRRWIETHWDFSQQWESFWSGAVMRALKHTPVANRPVVKAIAHPIPTAAERKPSALEGLTVVIPHGGADRLKLLAGTLGLLRQNPAVSQIIVAEGGASPLASELAARWNVEHVFVSMPAAFNKSRLLNVGSALARHDLTLWWDNDLIFPAAALRRAVAEMRAQKLDVFFPYARIQYLSEADSTSVANGLKDPADCRSTATLEAIRGAPGGLLIVRSAFVESSGGMCEEFRGWGGEDCAWLHKARHLGKVGVTSSQHNVAHHLWHRSSGIFGGDPRQRNSAYHENATLWEQISRLRTREALLARLPPPAYRPLPWSSQTHVYFSVADDASEILRSAALAWSTQLRERFGIDVSRPIVEAANVRALFGEAAQIQDRTFTVATALAQQADVSGLIQALSRFLAAAAAPLADIDPASLCVWMYWEGPCPEWISACQDTLRRHAPNVRVLNRADFAALWLTDRDIDISRLHVAHRSDFIRAYVLHHHGGLWIDSDCIALRSLAPVLERLRSCDFVGHRERAGLVSNAFMAARPGSVVAKAFYEQIATRLRSRDPLQWISLGNEPLTKVVEAATVPWFELDVEAVQPVCWSCPEAYFKRGSSAEHARQVNGDALCYMLSQQNVIRYQNQHPELRMTGSDTFFTYLLQRSNGESCEPAPSSGPGQHMGQSEQIEIFQQMHARHDAEGQASTSGPGSTLEQTAELRHRLPLVLQHLRVNSLLDAACGDFFWQRHTHWGVRRYVGTDILETVIRANNELFGSDSRLFLTRDARTEALPACDVVLCRDYLVHLCIADVWRTLLNFANSGARFLITTTFPTRPAHADIRNGDWRPLNLCAAPFCLPAPLCLINEKCTEGGGAFADKSLGVWRLADIRALIASHATAA